MHHDFLHSILFFGLKQFFAPFGAIKQKCSEDHKSAVVVEFFCIGMYQVYNQQLEPKITMVWYLTVLANKSLTDLKYNLRTRWLLLNNTAPETDFVL